MAGCWNASPSDPAGGRHRRARCAPFDGDGGGRARAAHRRSGHRVAMTERRIPSQKAEGACQIASMAPRSPGWPCRRRAGRPRLRIPGPRRGSRSPSRTWTRRTAPRKLTARTRASPDSSGVILTDSGRTSAVTGPEPADPSSSGTQVPRISTLPACATPSMWLVRPGAGPGGADRGTETARAAADDEHIRLEDDVDEPGRLGAPFRGGAIDVCHGSEDVPGCAAAGRP